MKRDYKALSIEDRVKKKNASRSRKSRRKVWPFMRQFMRRPYLWMVSSINRAVLSVDKILVILQSKAFPTTPVALVIKRDYQRKLW